MRAPDRSRDSGPPLLGFLLPSKRLYVRCPCSPGQPEGQPGGRRLPHLRRCRPQGSCPSRRIRLRSRQLTRALASSPSLRGAPTLRGLVTCRSRLFGAALQSFPFPRSRSCSRRPLLPCGFASDYRQRGVSECFTTAFLAASTLCHSPPGGEPRRMNPDDDFPRSLRPVPVSHSRVASNQPFSFTPGSPVSSRHARFEALLPPGVRSLATPCPGQGEAAASVLSWAFPL